MISPKSSQPFNQILCISIVVAGKTPNTLKRLKPPAVKTLIETNVFGRPNPHLGAAHRLSYFRELFLHAPLPQWVGHPLVSDRYATLYNPLDPKDFEGRSAQRTCEMVVGRYSRADDKKWHPWCYEMYPALARTLPAAQYNIAGATPAVSQFMAEHGLENRVHYQPLTHDRQALMGYLDAMNVFAHGSAIGES